MGERQMLTWLLVFGVGGCWSGYTDAAIIKAPDRESAMSMGVRIAWQETAEQRGYSHGCSCDVELIEGDVRKCALYVSRCKPGAQALADLAADGVQMYDSLKTFALEVAHG